MHWDTRTTQGGDGTRFASVVDDWFALNTYVHTVWTHGAQDKFYKNGAKTFEMQGADPNQLTAKVAALK